MIGQLLIDLTKMTPARILVLFVCLGVLFGAFGWYNKLVDFAGTGATIPLSGFGHTLMQGTIEAMTEKGLAGVFSGGLAASALGITVALMMGFTMAVLFNPKG